MPNTNNTPTETATRIAAECRTLWVALFARWSVVRIAELNVEPNLSDFSCVVREFAAQAMGYVETPEFDGQRRLNPLRWVKAAQDFVEIEEENWDMRYQAREFEASAALLEG